MKKTKPNILGLYGMWAAGLIDPDNKQAGDFPLSFLNPSWTDIEKWKISARAEALKLLSLPYENTWGAADFPGPTGGKTKFPGIFALHDHSGMKYFGKQKIIHRNRYSHPAVLSHQHEYYGGTAWANKLARRGYGVLVHHVSAAQHENIIAKALFSAGLSCGGLRTDYAAGLDSRIRCSVTAGFMTAWKDFLLHKYTWMIYIPLLPKLMDFPDILGMHAPLPVLVCATSENPLFTFEEERKAGRKLKESYKKAGASESFKFSIHEGPHKFDLPMQEEGFAWFDRWLETEQN